MRLDENAILAPADRGAKDVLDKMVRRIHRTDEFPSVSKYLIEINQKLSVEGDASHASELANVILKDYALTNKLLKLVNSAFYGFAAGKVTTITRAVVVLGYESIRLATIGLVLFEHFRSKSNAGDLIETVIASFWSGILARGIADSDDEIDPEEAFICALLSQLGKLLMIYYLPEEFRSINNWMLANGGSEADAVQKVCGIAYEDLGVAVGREWNFPPKILDSLSPIINADLQDKTRPAASLQILSSFVKELYGLIQQGGFSANDPAFNSLMDRYQARLGIGKKQIGVLLRDSLDKVQQHAQALNLTVEKSLFMKRLSSVFLTGAQQKPHAADGQETGGASYQLTDGKDLKACPAAEFKPKPKDIIFDGIQEIGEVMMAEHDVNDVFLMGLEVLYRALDFQRALMFIQEGQSKRMIVRFGYGQHSRRLVRRVGFKVGGRQDLFNLSIQVGKDLIVADAYDPKLNRLIPEWYRTRIDAPAFIFLPVIFQNICIGSLYADRDCNGQPISDSEHRHLSMLRNQLVLAIKFRQRM